MPRAELHRQLLRQPLESLQMQSVTGTAGKWQSSDIRNASHGWRIWRTTWHVWSELNGRLLAALKRTSWLRSGGLCTQTAHSSPLATFKRWEELSQRQHISVSVLAPSEGAPARWNATCQMGLGTRCCHMTNPLCTRTLKGKNSYPEAAFTPASPSHSLERMWYPQPSEHCFDPLPILSICIFLLFGRNLCVRWFISFPSRFVTGKNKM